jgi:FKBP-type peptidyl-prolyl cis-trans isomerase
MKATLQTMLGATAAAALILATGCVAQPTAPNARGLQYKVIKDGTGRTPTATDTVSTHYRGTLLDGREFDSSYKRNEPTEFPVNRVIKGWTEALQLMKEGSKWMLYIPPHLAYGERGAGGLIGPNETLIFEIELLKVK